MRLPPQPLSAAGTGRVSLLHERQIRKTRIGLEDSLRSFRFRKSRQLLMKDQNGHALESYPK